MRDLSSSAWASTESLLVEQVTLYKRSWRIGTVAMLAILGGASLVAWLFLPAASAWRLSGLAAILSPAALLPALFSLGDPRNAKVVRTLRERGSDVVWVYESAGNGTYFVVFALVDGHRVSFAAERRRVPDLIRAIAGLAPGCTVGFSPAHETAFIRDPSSLRKAPRDIVAESP